MRIKTIIVILITILLTIVLMENTENVRFNFLWASFWMPKLVMLTFVSVFAFILGVLVGRPRRVKKIAGDEAFTDHENKQPGTLSDEDKDYIN